MILWQEKVGVRGHRLIKFNICFLSMYYRLKFENCAVTSSESKVLIAPSCLTLCNSMDCSSPGSSVHEILQARILEWVAIPFSRDLPDPGIEPGSPTLQADSLLSEPRGKQPSTQILVSKYHFPIKETRYSRRKGWFQGYYKMSLENLMPEGEKEPKLLI